MSEADRKLRTQDFGANRGVNIAPAVNPTDVPQWAQCAGELSFSVPAFACPDLLAGLSPSVLCQWPWDGNTPVPATSLLVTCACVVDTAAGGTLSLYLGGTDGVVDGTLIASAVVGPSSFASFSFTGGPFTVPGAASLLKLVGVDDADTITVRGCRVSFHA